METLRARRASSGAQEYVIIIKDPNHAFVKFGVEYILRT
jgi:hypothetical protein